MELNRDKRVTAEEEERSCRRAWFTSDRVERGGEGGEGCDSHLKNASACVASGRATCLRDDGREGPDGI